MKANATPVFKKAKKKDLRNYRPASLSLSPGNILEQLILEIISKHPGQDSDREQSAQVYEGEIIPDQPDSLL